MYTQMLEYVKELFLSNPGRGDQAGNLRFPFRDRYQHTVRVCGWAERLLPHVPEACARHVRIAAIFHDVGYALLPTPEHALKSAEICRRYLQDIGFDRAEISKIVYLVAMHSEKNLPDSRLSPELRVLFDADLLDEVGALTVLWDCLDEGLNPNVSYYGARARIEREYLALLPKRARMRTRAGLLMYDSRMAWLKSFLAQLDDELWPSDLPSVWNGLSEEAR